MSPRARSVCPVKDCGEVTSGGRCPRHQRESDLSRGTARERGYTRRHETRFRAGVLARDRVCTCTDPDHGHGLRCPARATVADHYPLDRRQLVAAGLDPDDPEHGRGLCQPCHDRHTAAAQPGGWHRG